MTQPTEKRAAFVLACLDLGNESKAQEALTRAEQVALDRGVSVYDAYIINKSGIDPAALDEHGEDEHG